MQAIAAFGKSLPELTLSTGEVDKLGEKGGGADRIATYVWPIHVLPKN
jgi:hypothetical protein